MCVKGDTHSFLLLLSLQRACFSFGVSLRFSFLKNFTTSVSCHSQDKIDFFQKKWNKLTHISHECFASFFLWRNAFLKFASSWAFNLCVCACVRACILSLEVVSNGDCVCVSVRVCVCVSMKFWLEKNVKCDRILTQRCLSIGKWLVFSPADDANSLSQ